MAEGARLYAGTQEGLFVWGSQNGGWTQLSRAFPDQVVDALAGSRRWPERVYAGVAYDGLYRTDDGGLRWTRVLEGDVRAITVSPGDEAVLYAGTEPVRLYRSEDGGNHWEEFAGLQALPDAIRKQWWTPYAPHWGHVNHILVHPVNPSILYLALEHGGVVRSLDGGDNWEDVSGGIDYLDMHLVATLPGARNRYYVTSARGFFTSEEPARGWVRAEHGLTRSYSHDLVLLPPVEAAEVPTMLLATADGSPGAWRRENRRARAALFRS